MLLNPQQVSEPHNIQNAKQGLAKFQLQHSKNTQESMNKLMKMMEAHNALPLIPISPGTVFGLPVPRVNVGFNSFEKRSKSLAANKGVAMHL